MSNKKKCFDSRPYILLLISILLLIDSLKNYILIINNISISYSIFLLPFVSFIIHFIYRKSHLKDTLISIMVSSVVIILIQYVLMFSFHDELNLSNICRELICFIGSQVFGLCLYHYIRDFNQKSFIFIYLYYLLSITSFYLLYIILFIENWNLEKFVFTYCISMIIDCLILIPISFIEKKKL